MNVLALSFLHPLMLWGAGLAAIPLIIHILNKRRYRKIDWAAMEFLLRAFKENRRRMRFEQLLLLLLRMALVALLALLLSRPQASSDDFGGFTRRIVHHVMILDDSGSMGESSGVGTSADLARQQVTKIVEGLVRERSGDLLTILRSSSEEPELVARPVSSALPGEVKQLLEKTKPTPDRLRLPLVLDRVAQSLKRVAKDSDASGLHLYLVSDLKRVDLMGSEGRISEEIVNKLRAFELDKLRFKVVACGRSVAQNLAIIDIERKQGRSVVGQASEFQVTVQNQGAQSSGETELGFVVDGGSRLTRTIPALGPGAKHVETYKADFRKAGSHWVEADLPKDRLALDDRRAFCFPVAETANVLLIDGDPGERPELAESYYATIALDPTEDGSMGFSVRRIESFQLVDADFEKYDAVFLMNLASLDEKPLADLTKYVEEGGGLFLWTGDQVEPETWNQLFWKNGEGLLPAPIRGIDGDADKPEGIVMAPEPHEFFSGMEESFGQLLSFVEVKRYSLVGTEEGAAGFGGEIKLPKDTKVLIRVRDQRGPPLLLERPFGKGRVALMATTADSSWHVWPGNPTFPMLFRVATDFLMRRENLEPYNVGARQSFVRDLLASEYQPEAQVVPARAEDAGIDRTYTAVAPDDNPNMLRLDVAPEKNRPWPVAGCYKVVLGRIGADQEQVFFSVSPWVDEGQLAGLDKREFLSGLPAELADRTQWIDSQTLAQAGFLSDEGDVWRYLAFVLVAFVLLETVMAWRFGRR